MVWLGWKWAKWLGKWAMLKPYWHFRVKEKLIYTTENHQFWNILIMEKNYYYSFHRLIQELRKCLSPKNGNNFEFSRLYFLFPGLNISKLIIFICIHDKCKANFMNCPFKKVRGKLWPLSTYLIYVQNNFCTSSTYPAI